MPLVSCLLINTSRREGAAVGGSPPLVPNGTTFLLKGSMSLDFRVAALPYKSSSFATPEGEVCSTLSF